MVKDVVAALIVKDGRFLICCRPAHKMCPLTWEFVGGKVEPNETYQQALAREVKEELDIEIEVSQLLCQTTTPYPEMTINLYLFACTIIKGKIRLIEHVDKAWVNYNEVEEYELAQADQELVKILRSNNYDL